MNRKERRAAQKRGQGGAQSGSMSAEEAARTFAQAVQRRHNSDLETADVLCRSVLAAYPNHAGCLHLRGTIALQVGRPDVAVDFIGNAIAARKDIAAYHDDMGFALHAMGRADEAIGQHRLAIALNPDNSQSYINLAVKLLARNQREEAAKNFIRAMELTPEVFDASYPNVKSVLFKLNPAVETAVARAIDAWPRRLTAEELFGPEGFRALAGDLLFKFALTSAPARDMGLEKLLTSLRWALLQLTQTTREPADDDGLRLACALARQCFINEFVFDATSDEEETASRLRDTLVAAIETKASVSPLHVAVVGSYFPLGAIANVASLLDREWPAVLDEVLTQQVREPIEERKIRAMIPQLNVIADATSQLVRQQYEENPYPRWVLQPYPKLAAVPVEAYLADKFPLSPLLERNEKTMDLLVAGCGTGQHPMRAVRMFASSKILAVDLSLASLSYAQRQARKFGIENISFAQADLLTLGSLGRIFDVVDVSGVLHHLADPIAGLRALLSRVRARGFMRIGLYSEVARHDVSAAQQYCAERGYHPTVRDIRAARHDLDKTDLRSVQRFGDFFSSSECRDLLFHVQEHRFTMAQIGELLAAHDLRFIGFELTKAILASYLARFPNDPAMRQLENWQRFEEENPQTFDGMYQFWVQKP